MNNRCVRKCELSLRVVDGVAGVTTSGVCPHAPVNHMGFFLCHGFIIFMHINKILMKTTLSLFDITCNPL